MFKVQSLSHVRLFVTPWTVAHQVSLSMGFSRQEYWSGLPCPPPGALPDPGIELAAPVSVSYTAGDSFTTQLLLQGEDPKALHWLLIVHTIECRFPSGPPDTAWCEC